MLCSLCSITGKEREGDYIKKFGRAGLVEAQSLSGGTIAAMARRRNRIAPIAGAPDADKNRAGRRTRPRRGAADACLDLCTTCLLFNESVRRYLPEHHNKFPSFLAKMLPRRYLQTNAVPFR